MSVNLATPSVQAEGLIFARSGVATISDTQSHEVIASDGQQLMITKLTVVNRSLTDTMVTWLSGGVAVWRSPAPSTGGAVEPFPTPLALPKGGGLSAQASDGVSTIYVSACGYEITPPIPV